MPLMPCNQIILNLFLTIYSRYGKSSIINLLMRFYDPTYGEISIDGFKLKDFNVNSICSQVRIIQQEPMLFSTTIV